jgi:hypothetical protein
MPRSKKAAGTAADARNGRRIEAVTTAGRLERFELPGDSYCAAACLAWDAYWESGVAGMATPEDRFLLLSWIDSYNRAELLFEKADAEPEVIGHTGQPRPNGLYAVADRERSAALVLARQLGIGPRNRADLGVAVLTEQKTLQQLNDRYGDDDHQEQPDDDADDDPRGQLDD